MGLDVSKLRWMAALLGAGAVLLGAFGAHALRDGFTAAQLALWQTAVSYLFWHVLATLLALHVDTISSRTSGRAAAVLMLVGVVVFSGSLLALALSAPRWVGAITPIGGIALIAGWSALAWAYAQVDPATPPDAS
jgi:uncharacterized membrane protein YgdD (TMEM256/DUF423 family)